MNRGILYMLISTLAFSIMNLMVKLLPHIPANELILFRSAISLIISLAMIRIYKLNPLGNNHKHLFLRGFFGTIALTCYFFAIQKMPLASAVTIQNLSPVFTAIFAFLLLKEKLAPLQIIFFVVSFAGVAMVKGFDERVTMGNLALGLCSAIFAGLAYTYVRRLRNTDHPLVVVLYFPMVAIPVVGIWSLFNWVTPQGWDWLYILLIGVFTQIGQVFLTKSLHAEAPSKVIILKYMNVIYALIFGFFILGERHTFFSLMGIALVVVGIILNVSYKQKSVSSGDKT